MSPALVKPSVYLLAGPEIYQDEMELYFDVHGGKEWYERVIINSDITDAEALIEFASRRCYRSFEEGLNPNVQQVRKDSDDYFQNILSSGHMSVTEHSNFTFAFENVSRVFTHELVRTRVGVAMSQESMRYVRLTQIPFWFPDWATEDPVLMDRCVSVLEVLENHQRWMALHFKLEEPCAACNGTGWEVERIIQDERTVLARPEPEHPRACDECEGSGRKQSKGNFAMKKFFTSFMRRFAPDGVATGIIWTGNASIVRHVIALRTSTAAEEEIVLVFREVARRMIERFPLIFKDFFESNDGSFKATYGRAPWNDLKVSD